MNGCHASGVIGYVNEKSAYDSFSVNATNVSGLIQGFAVTAGFVGHIKSSLLMAAVINSSMMLGTITKLN